MLYLEYSFLTNNCITFFYYCNPFDVMCFTNCPINVVILTQMQMNAMCHTNNYCHHIMVTLHVRVEGGYLCLSCEFHVMSVCLSPPVVGLSDGLVSSPAHVPCMSGLLQMPTAYFTSPHCFLGCIYTLSQLLVPFCAPVIRGQRNTMLADQVETERDLGSPETC